MGKMEMRSSQLVWAVSNSLFILVMIFFPC